MSFIHTKFVKHYIIIFICFYIFGSQPAELGEEKAFFHGCPIQKPIIRIGLGVSLSDIRIFSTSGMKIYEINSTYRLVAEDADEAYIKGRRKKLNEKFIIQVAQTKEMEEAEIIAQEIRAKIENKVYVTENIKDRITGAFQVMVGDFLTRRDALSFIKILNQLGMQDTWIWREEISEKESKLLWILVNNHLKSLSDEMVLYFIPSSPQSFLSYNGRDYRGMFVLKTTSQGIVLINILNLEDYLKGVVPSELSPFSFSELEAHKAQAVAARTYAMRNLGMNGDLGFDLCDSPKSQFYKGKGAEHPLSSKAVELTKGEVALYKGQLINALYTSTCGGMTENVESIFEGPSHPYLRSTECVYEKQNEWLLEGKNLIDPVQVLGRDISPEIAYLMSLKVIPQETNPDFYLEKVSSEEAQSWLKNALALLGKKHDTLIPETSFLNYVSFAHYVVQGFDWHEKIESFSLESEGDVIAQDFKERKGEEREDLAYLIQKGIFPSFNDIKNPENPLTRGELAFYVWKIIQKYRNLNHEGIFKGLNENKIELEEGEEKKKLVLSPKIFLLRNNEGFNFFASQVNLLGGEFVRWIERDGAVQLLEIVYPALSNIMGRSSLFPRWQTRVSREQLEKRINQYYPIGDLVDIVPQKWGDSKRVVELLIKGAEAQATVKGFKIRRVLGLRETLFVTDREYNMQGDITHFTFFGRGLGHGVGLCQVGAFRMARSGASYREILKKYYWGIKISEIY